MKYSALVIICLFFCGCTGTIYTVKDPTFNEDGEVEGILFYGYKLEDKKVLLDRIRNPKTGEITHSMYEQNGSAKYCDPAVVVEKVSIADYSQPYAIKYVGSLFETRKFGVVLDKGMLASVNSESTPGPKVAAETLQTLASIREDILDGYIKQSEVASMKTLGNVAGETPTSGPIKCTESK